MYFSMAAIVAALNAGQIFILIQKKKYALKVYAVVAVFLFISFLHSTFYILGGVENNKQIKDIDTLIDVIKKENPEAIYSYAAMSNGISYLSGIPAYKNLIDVTSNQFKNGILNKTTITEEVTNSKILLILYASKQGDNLIIDSKIVDLDILKKNNCKIIHEHPLDVKYAILNHFVVMKCY